MSWARGSDGVELGLYDAIPHRTHGVLAVAAEAAVDDEGVTQAIDAAGLVDVAADRGLGLMEVDEIPDCGGADRLSGGDAVDAPVPPVGPRLFRRPHARSLAPSEPTGLLATS